MNELTWFVCWCSCSCLSLIMKREKKRKRTKKTRIWRKDSNNSSTSSHSKSKNNRNKRKKLVSMLEVIGGRNVAGGRARENVYIYNIRRKNEEKVVVVEKRER